MNPKEVTAQEINRYLKQRQEKHGEYYAPLSRKEAAVFDGLIELEVLAEQIIEALSKSGGFRNG